MRTIFAAGLRPKNERDESFLLEQPDVSFDRFQYVVKPAVVGREPQFYDPIGRVGKKEAVFLRRGVRYADRAIKDEEHPAIILEPVHRDAADIADLLNTACIK